MVDDVAFVGHGGLKTSKFGDARQECANIGIFQGDAGFDACVASHTKALETDYKKKNKYYCDALKTFIKQFEKDDISGIIESGRTLQAAIIERDKYGQATDPRLYYLSVRLVEQARGKEPKGGVFGSGGANTPEMTELRDPRKDKQAVIDVLKSFQGEC